MMILAVGHNHETAPVSVRERFAFSGENLPAALEGVRGCRSVTESVILSTCNRNEIYTVVEDPEVARADIAEFLHDFHQVERELLRDSLYHYEQEGAVEHLFGVTAGIDSMVVGETQVFGQVKDAYDAAHTSAATGPVLNRLFAASFEVGKRVRHRTRISEGAISVSSCAVDLARKIFTNLGDRSTLLIGAGDTTERTAAALLGQGVRRFVVANRTVERAAALADRLGGAGVPLERLPEALRQADIVVSSTAAPGYLLGAEDIKSLMQERRNAPLFVIDLSVPRDIDPATRHIHNVFLYNIDDLSAIAEDNRARRKGEISQAGDIITAEVSKFMAWLSSLAVAPTVVTLRESFETVRAAEFDRLRHKLPPETQERVEAFSRQLINKLLHNPSTEIKRSTRRGEDRYLSYAIRRLFKLDEPGDD
ncbi:MAG: glutamyl-tRNA reductase [Candidatus Krumholzibacteria bacterium]|nr:glutamyl-tRNA reductase [Candidatus Krumholzibacteria bacterium]